MENRRDIYAGDAAWREWFAKCAVSRCGAENACRLGAQIRTAMYAQLARFGFSCRDTGNEDPVSVFDTYFMLKGSRDSAKPLKAYFVHRILVEGLRLVDFVCGTLFGARSGRVHDIAIDWIATFKGWKPRSLRDADGPSSILAGKISWTEPCRLQSMESQRVTHDLISKQQESDATEHLHITYEKC